MTVENSIKLLKAYKKQMENPVSDTGIPYTGDQRKHAIARSKRNYKMMATRILSSKKFLGGVIMVRNRACQPAGRKVFERHPIVDELEKEFGLKKEVKKEEKVEEPKPEEKPNGKKPTGRVGK